MCSSLSVLSLTVHVNSYGKSCSYSHYKFCNEHVAEIWISCVFSLIYFSTIAFAKSKLCVLMHLVIRNKLTCYV